jgi:hypothetical protein
MDGMTPDRPYWEFCLCYLDGEFSHWKWRYHRGEAVRASASGFPTLSACVHDAMKHGYTGGGRIVPGIVGNAEK